MKSHIFLTFSVVISFCTSALAQDQIIDTHAHIMLPGQERAFNPKVEGTAEELRRQMGESGVTMAGIMSIVPRDNSEVMKTYNDHILELAAESSDFFPIVSVHPMDGQSAIDEVERVAKLGAKALKLHPFFQGFDVADPNVLAVAKKAGEEGLPVIFDSISASDGGMVGKFVDIAIANPDTKFVLAHMGGYRFHEMILFAVFAKGPFYNNNVYFDLSAVIEIYADSPRQEDLLWTMREIGMDQFLFATDFPIFDLAKTRELVESFGFTDAEKKKIYHDNAVKVFELN